MVTSLGLNAETSFASARAGISRCQELDNFTLWSPSNGEISSAKVHQIPQVTAGFEGAARLIRILGAAFSELKSREPHIDWEVERTASYLALPDRFRVYRGAELIADAEIRESVLASERQIPADDVGHEQALDIYNSALKSAAIPTAPALKSVSRADNCAMAECIRDAIKDLSTRAIHLAIVAGVDSLLDEATLQWLSFSSRLKSPTIPTGLIPGEAGAVICLERDLGRSETLARIKSVHCATEDNSLYSRKPVLGRALAEVIQASVSKLEPPVWIVTDHNGEEYRALEWGHALRRLNLNSPDVTYPAVSFGDTGAASVGVAIGQVIHGFRRKSAPRDAAVVLSTSTGAKRMSLVIEK